MQKEERRLKQHVGINGARDSGPIIVTRTRFGGTYGQSGDKVGGIQDNVWSISDR